MIISPLGVVSRMGSNTVTTTLSYSDCFKSSNSAYHPPSYLTCSGISFTCSSILALHNLLFLLFFLRVHENKVFRKWNRFDDDGVRLK